jgi:DNA-binding Lrp family transcriptional regulator
MAMMCAERTIRDIPRTGERAPCQFCGALAKIPQVVEAHLVSGRYDYLVKVVTLVCMQLASDHRHQSTQ